MNDCILWSGQVNNRGYGLTYRDRKRVSAHREAFRQANGYLPEVVMHTCDTPRCVNPAHLVAGTQSENMLDCAAKGRLKSPLVPRSGETNGMAKISDADAAKIRILRHTVPTRQIARMFGVSESTLRKHARYRVSAPA